MVDIKKNYWNLLTKKKRSFSVKLDSKTIKRINNLVNSSLEKKFDLKNKDKLKSLELTDIKKIDQNIRGLYQKKLVKILKPKIQKITDQIFDNDELSEFRVGGQCKFKKTFKSSDNNKVEYKKIKDLNKYNLPLKNDLVCFETKPHQDLSNQGFRSTMSLIFYLQLTDHYKDSCLMQISDFKNKSGLYEFSSDKFYPNEIKKDLAKKFKWYVPKEMKPGNIFIMDSITPHNSSPVSSIPRLAINVKIQPKSLNYMYRIFNLKKKFKNNLKYNFEVMENDIKYCTEYSNSLNFELAVLYAMQRKFDKAFEAFNKFTLTKFSKEKIEKILAGAFFRKTFQIVTKSDMKLIYKKDFEFANLSCADSILRTFK